MVAPGPVAAGPTPSTGPSPGPARQRGLLAVGLVCLAVALGGTVLLAGQERPSGPEVMCATHAELLDSLAEPSTFSTQRSVYLARRLSAVVADVASTAGGGAPSLAGAAEAIDEAIGVFGWETDDLVTATRPVALACGWTWPVTSSPPAQRPTPPAG